MRPSYRRRGGVCQWYPGSRHTAAVPTAQRSRPPRFVLMVKLCAKSCSAGWYHARSPTPPLYAPIRPHAPPYAAQALLDSSASNVLCIPVALDRLLYVPDVPVSSLGKHCDTPPRIVALPGSFNPLHAGHEAALRNCVALCDPALKPCPLYELSVFNVDKPPVPLADLQHRLSHFSRQNVCVLLTKTPRFIDKARAYPGMSYVIGVDTLVRLVDPVYTGGSCDLMESALAAMVASGSEFFVLPRLFGSVKIPAKFGFQLKDGELLTYSMAS